jgi:hypothetical protein
MILWSSVNIYLNHKQIFLFIFCLMILLSHQIAVGLAAVMAVGMGVAMQGRMRPVKSKTFLNGS